MTTNTEAKLLSWGCAEIQHYRGRGAIVMQDKAILEPVSIPTMLPVSAIKNYPVCKVSVPVILESREQTISYYYFNNIEIARIMYYL